MYCILHIIRVTIEFCDHSTVQYIDAILMLCDTSRVKYMKINSVNNEHFVSENDADTVHQSLAVPLM